MVNTESNRHSLQLFKEQLQLENIDIETVMFVKKEIAYNYNEEQFFCDLMDIEDAYSEEFNFRICEKKSNSQLLSFYPNYIIYIYVKQYGMEYYSEESSDENMKESFEDMELSDKIL